MQAAPHEHALELGRLAHELEILLLLAESHHPLDTGAVVPGPVEQQDLARGRKVLNVALEVPLSTLDLGRFLQRDHARAARIEVLHEPLDRTALAGGVPSLEQDHDALAGFS